MNTLGICTDCKEWTDAKDPCCGAAVYVDGGFMYYEDFEDEELEEDKK